MKVPILICTVLTITLAHRTNRGKIPNGYTVPNPCHPGHYWEAVGHNQAHSGHHGNNQFGLDFKNIGGYSWTTELCQTDSDGDGRTNGYELGDPDCKWVSGATPSGPAVGHPGICEPITSPSCNYNCH